MTGDVLNAILAGLGTGIGVYAAIRADIARINLLAQHAHDSAGEAHRRIDSLRNGK
jgi:hypothetical protein